MNSSIVSAETKIPFQIQLKHPMNQISANNYADLKILPNTTQELTYIVSNSDNQNHQFKIEVNDATTTDGLTISYTDSKKHTLSSPRLTDMVTSEKEQIISVDSNSQKEIKIKLQYPENYFKGIILGGVTIYEADSMESSNTNNSLSITNRFSYSSAIRLSQEADLNVVPKISALDAVMTESNSYPFVKFHLKNESPVIIPKLSVDIDIKELSGNTVATYQKINGQIAPNSDFNILIELPNGALNPGTYKLLGTATSGSYHWTFDHSLIINDNSYTETNTKSIIKPQIHTNNLLVYLLASIIVIMLLLLIILIYKLRRKKNE